ncbi:MAG: methylenetetrahydrofolate reductase, partial [Desulfofustis sp.]|nr:methylenetetrahydrofolate reductase [Desulfofustis sp.]
YMEQTKKQGLHERVKILAGVTPLKSVGMAKFMNKMVAGIDIPEAVIKRLADEPKEKQAAKGIEMCIEQIQQLREMEGIAGVHVMAIEWEEKLKEIIGGAGLLPRPVVDEQ